MSERSETHQHPWPTEHGPWRLTYRLGFVEGRPECIGLTIDPHDRERPQPLRSTELRALAHGFRSDSSELAAALERFGASDSPWVNSEAISSMLSRPCPAPARSGGHGPDHYRHVVAVYLSGGSAPTRAVQEEFGVSYSTARSWVTAARRLGLLARNGRGRVSGLVDDQGTDGEDEERD